jgi:hypothetical protein
MHKLHYVSSPVSSPIPLLLSSIFSSVPFYLPSFTLFLRTSKKALLAYIVCRIGLAAHCVKCALFYSSQLYLTSPTAAKTDGD